MRRWNDFEDAARSGRRIDWVLTEGVCSSGNFFSVVCCVKANLSASFAAGAGRDVVEPDVSHLDRRPWY